MRLLIFSIIIFLGFALTSSTSGETPKIISSKDVFSLVDQTSDTTYLLHLWATWCVPCIKELPQIERIAQELKGQKFKLILLSLDFEEQIDSRLLPFLEKHHIKSDSYLLKQERGYEWINAIDPEWSGAIPASLLLQNTKRDFYEKSFEYEELKELIITKYME